MLVNQSCIFCQFYGTVCFQMKWITFTDSRPQKFLISSRGTYYLLTVQRYTYVYTSSWQAHSVSTKKAPCVMITSHVIHAQCATDAQYSGHRICVCKSSVRWRLHFFQKYWESAWNTDTTFAFLQIVACCGCDRTGHDVSGSREWRIGTADGAVLVFDSGSFAGYWESPVGKYMEYLGKVLRLPTDSKIAHD